MVCLGKNKIVEEILKGNPVILPTETVYGIGVRCDYPNSVDKLFEIKMRDKNKPISLHMTKNMLDQFNIPAKISKLCDRLFPGPFTLIIESEIPYGFHSDSVYTGKIGIRVPENVIFQEILDIVQVPLCMTSANISTCKNAEKFEDIELDFPGIEDDINVSGQESIIIDTTNMKVVRS